MKKWICVAAVSLFATASFAEERHFACVAASDGSEVRVSRAAAGESGTIETKDMTGDVLVLKGIGNLTFLYMAGEDVMTMVVHDDLSFDLSVKGPRARTDRGTCEETGD